MSIQQFWQLQLDLIILLKQLGIELKPNARLKPFVLHRQMELVHRIAPEDERVVELVKTIQVKLGELVKLRTAGFEPDHEGGFYK